MNTTQWVLNNSFQLIQDSNKSITNKLDDDAHLFIDDIKDYYTEIKKSDAIITIKNFLENNIYNIILQDGITIPVNKVITVLNKTMNKNSFQFGNTFWH